MKDIKLTADFDLEIVNGDFVAFESTYQHQQCLLLAEKGSFKQYPETGVGAASYLKDENPDDLLREIRQEFTNDGMTVKRLGFEGTKLKIEAGYGQ
jgi:hypothetical protein